MLRPYQQECITALHENIQNNKKSLLVQLPMGTGKTVIFANFCREFNTKILIIAHLDVLLHQIQQQLARWHPTAKTAILGKQDHSDADILISSIQTACREYRLQQIKTHNPQLIIIDEAHHACANSYQTLIEKFPLTPRIGFSATPYRLDGLGMNRAFDHIAYAKTFHEMIESGYLCETDGISIKTGIDLEATLNLNLEIFNREQQKSRILTDQTAKDFEKQQREIERLIENDLVAVINTDLRNKLVAETYLEKAQDRKHTIGFTINVSHAKNLTEKFQSYGIPTSYIEGYHSPGQRNEILNNFYSGKTKVLFNCLLLTEGFDCPQIDCVLMCRPTASQALYTQCIGRGLRKYPDKKNCLLIDFCDTSNLSLCTLAQMFDKPKDPSPPLYPEKKPDEEDEEDEEKESKKLLLVSDNTLHITQKDHTETPWHNLPPTQKQIDIIAKIYPTKDLESLTRKQAFDLLSERPATPAQLYRLKKEGHDISEPISFWKASKLINQYIKEKTL